MVEPALLCHSNLMVSAQRKCAARFEVIKDQCSISYGHDEKDLGAFLNYKNPWVKEVVLLQ